MSQKCYTLHKVNSWQVLMGYSHKEAITCCIFCIKKSQLAQPQSSSSSSSSSLFSLTLSQWLVVVMAMIRFFARIFSCRSNALVKSFFLLFKEKNTNKEMRDDDDRNLPHLNKNGNKVKSRFDQKRKKRKIAWKSYSTILPKQSSQ